MPLAPAHLATVAAALDAAEAIVAVLEPAPGAIGGLRFLDIGDALLRALGHSRAALTGEPLTAIAAPEAGIELRAIAAAALAGQAWRGELLCLGQAGRRFWLGCQLIPTAAGPFVLHGRDITAQRLEADQSRAANSLLAKSFMLADTPLAIVSPEGRYLMGNHCWESLLGVRAGALAGALFMDGVAPSSRGKLQSARERQSADGTAFRLDIELLTAEGRFIPAMVACALVEPSDRQRYRVITLRLPDTPAPAGHQVAGRLRFISLDAIREQIGERWEAIADRVMDTAERIIRKRLSRTELVLRDERRGFTVCFTPETEEEEATFRATAIAREIRQHLIGHGEAEDGLVMQVVIERVPVQPAEPVAAQVARHLDRAEAGLAWQAGAGRPPAVRPVLAPLTRDRQALLVAPPPPRPGTAILPERRLEDALSCLAWAAEPEHAALPLLLEVDFDLFLKRNKSERYIEECRRLPKPVREGLVFLLAGLPRGITLSLLQDVARRLRPLGAGLGCVLEGLEPPDFDLRLCPLAWVVVDLLPFGEAPPLERLRRLALTMDVHRVRLLVTGAASGETFRCLHDCGAQGIALAEEAAAREAA